MLHLFLSNICLLSLALVVDVYREQVFSLIYKIEAEVKPVSVINDDFVPALGDKGDVFGVFPVHDRGIGDFGIFEGR